MKPKNFGKKLSLNKKTIVNLNSEQMTEVLGGQSGPDTTCLETRLGITCTSCPSGCFTDGEIACTCGLDN